MILVQNWQFLHFLTLDKIDQESEFHKYKSKNWDISKGVSQRFWSKTLNFFIVLF